MTNNYFPQKTENVTTKTKTNNEAKTKRFKYSLNFNKTFSTSSTYTNFKAKQESTKEKKLYEEKIQTLRNHINALKKQQSDLDKKALKAKENEKIKLKMVKKGIVNLLMKNMDRININLLLEVLLFLKKLSIIQIKNDLDDKREVNKEEAELKAQKNKFAFMETSAKDNNNVDKAFETLFKEIVKNYKDKNGGDIGEIKMKDENKE